MMAVDRTGEGRFCTEMKTRTTMDKSGRIRLPRRLLKEWNLQPGDALEAIGTGDQITLRPVRVSPPVTQEHGVWVLHTGQPLPASLTETVRHQIHEERENANLVTRE
jgi:bifunctional DNA-binding transcriptional regulator/antitoxin component of YhaV-PrlF toxin-antitoxin module